MTLETLRQALMWCSIINMGLLFVWFLFMTLTHDWVYGVHRRWFKLSVERFDEIHYTGITFFKIIVFVFNLVPFLALCIVG